VEENQGTRREIGITDNFVEGRGLHRRQRQRINEVRVNAWWITEDQIEMGGSDDNQKRGFTFGGDRHPKEVLEQA